MIQKFVDAFIAAEPEIKKELSTQHPDGYNDLVKRVIQVLSKINDYGLPDPDKITVIDHGNYQGTKLYIIPEQGYQPSRYWAVFVSYGSCSGCDTFEAINSYSSDPPTEQQVNDYWALMLHMVQNMKQIGGYSE